MNIIVLAGGLSPERDVSLSSGSLIANALISNGHRVLLIDLFFSLLDSESGLTTIDFESYYSANKRDSYEYTVPPGEPDLDAMRREHGSCPVGEGVIELCKSADVTFLALHGDIGENGKLQALLDIHGVKYTGSGYAGSLLAMDKCVAKELFVQHGIPTVEWREYDLTKTTAGDILGENELPLVIKPNSCGSSVGVSIVRSGAELEAALDYARKYEPSVLAEKFVEGREFSVGVLDGEALPPIEIIPRAGFYDYKNKYQPGFTEEVCPADIDEATDRTLRSAALKAHRALRLGSYSRADFILDAGGRAWCLEVNTLPGMTPTSLLPQEAAAVGICYEQLCEKLVELAL